MDYIKINIKKHKTANTVSSSTGIYINELVEQNLVAIEIIEIDKFKKTKYHEYNKKYFFTNIQFGNSTKILVCK